MSGCGGIYLDIIADAMKTGALGNLVGSSKLVSLL